MALQHTLSADRPFFFFAVLYTTDTDTTWLFLFFSFFFLRLLWRNWCIFPFFPRWGEGGGGVRLGLERGVELFSGNRRPCLLDASL